MFTYKKRHALLAALLMMMSVGTGAQTFDDYNGKTVVLAASKDGESYAMNYSVYTSSSNSGRVDKIPISINADGKVVYLTTETEQKKILWTIGGSKSNATILSLQDNKYLSIKDSSPKLEKAATSSSTYKWAFSSSYKTFTYSSDKYGILMESIHFRMDNTSYITNSTYLYPIAKPYFLADHTWRTLGSSSFGTICLPKAVRADEVAGATFYEVAAKVMDGEEFKGVVLREVTDGLKAGTPYIYKRAGESTYIVAAMHGDAVKANTLEAGLSDEQGLVGTLTGSTDDGGFPVPAGMYILQGDQLWLTTATTDAESGASVSQTRLLAGRAYIDPSQISRTVAYEDVEEEAAGVKGIVLGVDAPYDGIHAPQGTRPEGKVTPPTAFNLTGRRVSTPHSGLFVANGKVISLPRR